ncbi:MAG: hypothetical protein JJ868_08145 [Shimia sp.]|uniref:hypothetical protein n=1 Tax=Shimia sp. TaxID=1954381 RepID=UPI001B2CA1CF|nr:hypothetical protein [Shimia sp.]MBO6897326.1 hypothetical protein [Shimia sp.]
MCQRIYAVDEVSLTRQDAQSSNLLVQVQARAVTSGWRTPTLKRHSHKNPPEDGILTYDLQAIAPNAEDTVLPVLTRVCADTALTAVDIKNFWGPGQPLVGVRCNAQSNTKLTLLESRLGGSEMAAAPQQSYSEEYIPQFARDIRPLFRPYDIAMMMRVRDLDLGSYETVCKHGTLILSRLKDGSMPNDGPWPASDVALFEQWLLKGKAP